MDILTIILLFFGGLFLGLAIKKGVVSIILFIIAILILSYAGIHFANISYYSLLHIMFYEFNKHFSIFYSDIPSLGTGFIVFIIGLAIGLWKG